MGAPPQGQRLADPRRSKQYPRLSLEERFSGLLLLWCCQRGTGRLRHAAGKADDLGSVEQGVGGQGNRVVTTMLATLQTVPPFKVNVPRRDRRWPAAVGENGVVIEQQDTPFTWCLPLYCWSRRFTVPALIVSCIVGVRAAEGQCAGGGRRNHAALPEIRRRW